ncbi:MAG: response regulator transcription factor [Planctomycetes bacterium]|nr:response regulator transcription factor [Planctomycetota bacterium]
MSNPHKAKPAAAAPARVLVVDDHPVVRQGLALLINHEPDLAVCGEAATAAEALKAIADTRPDVAIVDLSLKGASGLDLIKDIKVRHPGLPVLVLSMSDENVYAERALRAGARGYMMKEEATEKVLTALRRVLAGAVYLSDAMASRLLSQFVAGDAPGGGSPVDRLSDRELEVFRLIGQGLGTGEIAHRLHLSPKTIETHRAHIKVKLGLDSGTDLLRQAIRFVEDTTGAA